MGICSRRAAALHGQPDRGVGRLRTAIAEKNLFGRWDVLANFLGELDFFLRRADADEPDILNGPRDRGIDGVVIVTEHVGAKSRVIVNIVVVVRVRNHGTFRPDKDSVRPAPSQGRIHAAGNDFACRLVSLFAFCVGPQAALLLVNAPPLEMRAKFVQCGQSIALLEILTHVQ